MPQKLQLGMISQLKTVYLLIIISVTYRIYLTQKIEKNFKSITFLETPNFLVSEKQLEVYYSKNESKKTIIHANFYNWVKSESNVLTEIKSYDTENRNALPDSVKIPILDTSISSSKKEENKMPPCPKCKVGTIIKGKTAYGCSHWKSGCDFRFSFEDIKLKANGKALTKELVLKIIGS